MRRVVSTMAPTKREKAFCVLEFAKNESVITVQRRFRTHYGKDPPPLVRTLSNSGTRNLRRKGACVREKAPEVSGADPAGVSMQSKEVDVQSKCGAAAAPTNAQKHR
jgi:hypothetical protein